MTNEAAERLLASTNLAAYREVIRDALREERAAERRATVERIRAAYIAEPEAMGADILAILDAEANR